MPKSPPQRELTLILTDLYLAPELRDPLAGSMGSGGTLAGLELLLARASRRSGGDWRGLACEIARLPSPASVPVAAVSRAGAGAPPMDVADHWWVATPVHLQAAHDHVQLGEVLSLDAGEWIQLTSQFNREFAGEIGLLQAGRGTEAYLTMKQHIEASAVDPARVVGCDVHDSLPGGPQGSVLRRQMTAVQMWLHDHPLNAARERRGLPAANGLWLWGSGALPAMRGAEQLPSLFSDDPFLRGLWLLRGNRSPVQARPDTAKQLLRDLQSGSADAVVSLALRDLQGATWLERLGTLEHQWLAPLIAALRGRMLGTLRLHVNELLFTLQRRDLWRIWRRPRPWLEAIT